jgi:beta-lactamase regulating signal transducer with metallopeptidase domain
MLLAGLWAVFALPVLMICFDLLGLSRLRIDLGSLTQHGFWRSEIGIEGSAAGEKHTHKAAVESSQSSLPKKLLAEPEYGMSVLAPVEGVPAVPTIKQIQPQPATTEFWRRLWIVFVAVWATGAVLRSFGLVRSLRTLRRIVRDSQLVTVARVVNTADSVRAQLNLKRPIAVIESDAIQSPVAPGLVGSCVLFPVGLPSRLSDADLRAVLFHEGAHLKRRDHFAVLAQEVLASSLWWNPVVHLFNGELTRAREDVCDNFALGVLDSVSYCDLLLRISRLLPCKARLLGASSMWGARWKLEDRVASILNERRYTMTRISTFSAIGVGAVFLLISTFLGITTLASAEESEPKVSDISSTTSEAGEQTWSEQENLDLAQQLQEAQKEVANLKRADLVEEGNARTIRPKFAEALKRYEGLREEVAHRHNRLTKSTPDQRRGGHELVFNGVTSYVELPTLKYNGEIPYTIEAIVSPFPIPGFKINPETHSYAHYMAIATDTEFGGIELGLLPDRFSFDVRAMQLLPGVKQVGGYVKAEAPALPFLEENVHIAAVLENDEIRLYRNGKCVARSAFAGPVGTSPFTMRIGCSPHPVTECHEMFCGRIDEVRFSKSGRYDDDFKPAAKLDVDDATVALYHFDEGEGNEVRDASGNKHHGIIHDARWVRVGE